MAELIKGSWYNIPGKGAFVYCGMSLKSNMAVLRSADCPLSATYIHPDYAKSLRLIRNQPHELPALMLNNRGNVKRGEFMFFENDSGIHCGFINDIEGDVCSLNVEGMTREVHLRHLFSYDNIYQMQARQVFRQSLSGESSANKKQVMASTSTPEACCV